MTRDFTNIDAKELFLKHEQLINRVYRVENLCNKEKGHLKSQHQKLVKKGTIEEQISAEINEEDYRMSPDIQAFIIDFFRCIKFLKAEKRCEMFMSEQGSAIVQLMNKLRPATGILRWTFSSNEKQIKAIDAYQELLKILEDDYVEIIDDITSILEDYDNADITTSFDEAYKDFDSKRDFYKKAFRFIIAGEVGKKPTRALSGVLRKQYELRELEKTLATVKEGKESAIRNAGRIYAAKEALNILREVPVEEAKNQGATWLRVKALHEHGYDSMADIFAASVYQLRSVRGISDNAAYNLKSIAAQILRTSESAARIRLNVDNKDRESTQLVQATLAYKDSKEEIDSVDSFNAEYGEKIAESTECLQKVGDGIEWLFYSEDEKQEVIDAKDFLEYIYSSGYKEKLDRAIESLRIVRHHTDNEAWEDFKDNPIVYYNILERVIPDLIGSTDSTYGLPEELAREIQEESFFPDGLLCELRPYQEWGVKYALHQEKVLLGDEMGLGKTIQAIATMVSLRNTGATHFLVICPLSVLSNWCREIGRHSKLRVTRVHGIGREYAIKSWNKTGGVAVTTYETTKYFDSDDFKADLIVVDEAHYIKNEKAKRTQQVKRLCKTKSRLLFMTGTALENRVDEMISLVSILQPALSKRLQAMAFMSTAPQFRETVAPVYYRRKRNDVLQELPELIESEEWCTLTPQEEAVYESTVLEKNYSSVRRVSWNVEDIRFSSKANRMLELIADAQDENRKIIVFSFFLDTIRRVSLMLGDKCYGPINGSVPPAKRQEILDAFDSAPEGSVLAAQIQSGGTGLNIQEASVVIICEPQFKPSIENQAISRAYRMGQARNVLVYRLLCENTVDERLTDMLARKQAIFDAFADKSKAAEESLEIDSTSFGEIIEEEIERINKKNGVDTEDIVHKKDSVNHDEVISYEADDSNEDIVPKPIIDNPTKDIKTIRTPTIFDIINEDQEESKEDDNEDESVPESPSNAEELDRYSQSDRETMRINSHEFAVNGNNNNDNNRVADGPAGKRTDLDALMKMRGYEVIDNRNTSGILWIIVSRNDYVNKKASLETLFDSYNYDYKYESRGAVATEGRSAYRIMIGED